MSHTWLTSTDPAWSSQTSLIHHRFGISLAIPFDFGLILNLAEKFNVLKASGRFHTGPCMVVQIRYWGLVSSRKLQGQLNVATPWQLKSKLEMEFHDLERMKNQFLVFLPLNGTDFHDFEHVGFHISWPRFQRWGSRHRRRGR